MKLSRALRVGVTLLAGGILGCATMHQIGYLPDMPTPAPALEPCDERLRGFLHYSQNLANAYGARATLNDDAIYVAGILALATIAATGGLAAAGAATLSIALVSISGAFVTGSFALINNPALAQHYRTAQREVSEAALTAQNAVGPGADPAVCAAVLAKLRDTVTAATNKLEQARTNVAIASGQHADQDLQSLQTRVANIETAAPTPAPTAIPQ